MGGWAEFANETQRTHILHPHWVEHAVQVVAFVLQQAGKEEMGVKGDRFTVEAYRLEADLVKRGT